MKTLRSRSATAGVDFFRADGERVGRGDVHGDLAADRGQDFLVAGRLQRNQHAELAEAVAGSVVDVGRDDAVRRLRAERAAAQRHVLADRGDRILDACRRPTCR